MRDLLTVLAAFVFGFGVTLAVADALDYRQLANQSDENADVRLVASSPAE